MSGKVIHNIPEQPQTLVALKNALQAQQMEIPQNDLNRLTALVKCHETHTETANQASTGQHLLLITKGHSEIL